jgi:hypothetical protein
VHRSTLALLTATAALCLACGGTKTAAATAPDGGHGQTGAATGVGAPCTIEGDDPACGSGGSCNDEKKDGFPGGYCTIDDCPSTPCPNGSVCARLGGDPASCYATCTRTTDCRTGYACQDVTPLLVGSAGAKVCYLVEFGCHVSADCPKSAPTCALDDGDPDGTCM